MALGIQLFVFTSLCLLCGAGAYGWGSMPPRIARAVSSGALKVYPQILLLNARTFVACVDTNLTTYSTENGEVIRSFQLPSNITKSCQGGFIAATYRPMVIIFGCSDDILEVDMSTATVLWHRSLPTSLRLFGPQGILYKGIFASEGPAVFFPVKNTTQGHNPSSSILALNTLDGTVLWMFDCENGVTDFFALSYNLLAVQCFPLQLTAIAISSSSSVNIAWQVNDFTQHGYVSTTCTGGMLFCAFAGQGFVDHSSHPVVMIRGISLTDGSKIFEHNATVPSLPTLVSDILITASGNDAYYVFNTDRMIFCGFVSDGIVQWSVDNNDVDSSPSTQLLSGSPKVYLPFGTEKVILMNTQSNVIAVDIAKGVPTIVHTGYAYYCSTNSKWFVFPFADAAIGGCMSYSGTFFFLDRTDLSLIQFADSGGYSDFIVNSDSFVLGLYSGGFEMFAWNSGWWVPAANDALMAAGITYYTTDGSIAAVDESGSMLFTVKAETESLYWMCLFQHYVILAFAASLDVYNAYNGDFITTIFVTESCGQSDPPSMQYFPPTQFCTESSTDIFFVAGTRCLYRINEAVELSSIQLTNSLGHGDMTVLPSGILILSEYVAVPGYRSLQV